MLLPSARKEVASDRVVSPSLLIRVKQPDLPGPGLSRRQVVAAAALLAGLPRRSLHCRRPRGAGGLRRRLRASRVVVANGPVGPAAAAAAAAAVEGGGALQSRFPPENPIGNVEYKLKLSADVGSQKFEELVSQLNWRMRECADDDEACAGVDDLGQYREAIYRLGVADDGQVVGLDPQELTRSVNTLRAMAERLSAVATVVSMTPRNGPENRTAATVLIRAKRPSRLDDVGWREVRVCTVGNVDSGKSTLLGVLTKGLKDDGRGKARASVLRHRHEQESGRTSSVANLLLGFDETGQVVNYKEDEGGAFRSEVPEHRAAIVDKSAAVVERAAKLITFADLCGHEKYFKTTLMGLVGLNPDYLLCTIDANRGEMRGMVHEHLLVANALSIPTIVCMTKCDMAKTDVATAALLDLKLFLKQVHRPYFVIKERQDVIVAAERVLQGCVPVVRCSAVTGEMIPELKLLLNLLARRTVPRIQEDADKKLFMTVEHVFPQVPGVGLVVLGRVVRGSVSVGDTLKLGPMIGRNLKLVRGGFAEVRVSSIRFEDVPSRKLPAGTTGTLALKGLGRAKALLDDSPRAVSRGMVILEQKSDLAPSMWLKATVKILQHPSSIRLGYEPVLHIGMLRQSARVMAMRNEETDEAVTTLRAGDTAEVLFRWLRRAQVLEPGSALVFREGLVKGIGTVTWVGEVEAEATGDCGGLPATPYEEARRKKFQVHHQAARREQLKGKVNGKVARSGKSARKTEDTHRSSVESSRKAGGGSKGKRRKQKGK